MSTSRLFSDVIDTVYCSLRNENFLLWIEKSAFSASRRRWWSPRSCSSVCRRSETSPTFASSERICVV